MTLVETVGTFSGTTVNFVHLCESTVGLRVEDVLYLVDCPAQKGCFVDNLAFVQVVLNVIFEGGKLIVENLVVLG